MTDYDQPPKPAQTTPGKPIVLNGINIGVRLRVVATRVLDPAPRPTQPAATGKRYVAVEIAEYGDRDLRVGDPQRGPVVRVGPRRTAGADRHGELLERLRRPRAPRRRRSPRGACCSASRTARSRRSSSSRSRRAPCKRAGSGRCVTARRQRAQVGNLRRGASAGRAQVGGSTRHPSPRAHPVRRRRRSAPRSRAKASRNRTADFEIPRAVRTARTSPKRSNAARTRRSSATYARG